MRATLTGATMSLRCDRLLHVACAGISSSVICNGTRGCGASSPERIPLHGDEGRTDKYSIIPSAYTSTLLS
jgi:hypothetical protein